MCKITNKFWNDHLFQPIFHRFITQITSQQFIFHILSPYVAASR